MKNAPHDASLVIAITLGAVYLATALPLRKKGYRKGIGTTVAYGVTKNGKFFAIT